MPLSKEQKITVIDQPGEISSFVGNMMLRQIQKWCHEDPDILEGFEEWEKEYMSRKEQQTTAQSTLREIVRS